MKITKLATIARNVRRDIISSTTAAQSGHPTSSLSAVELAVGLLFGGTFHADLNRPNNPDNDRLIFSKGHAAPLLYALYAAAGKVSADELATLRQDGSRLEGHPMPLFPYTEVPTGSLGQGLSAGIGIALAGRIDKKNYQTYVLLGDSEMAEGSVWEAIQFAAHYKLGKVTAILDVNRLGQSGPTMVGHNVQTYAKRLQSFGWKTIIVDGHDLEQIVKAFKTSRTLTTKPTCIIAKTIKGKGVSFLENREGWHGWALTHDEAGLALREIGATRNRTITKIPKPKKSPSIKDVRLRSLARTRYKENDIAATRTAVGNALVRLGSINKKIVVLDAEVRNSTYSQKFLDHFPDRFVETYIAEQNMVGIANGLASRGKLPVSSTFAAFLTRAFDQIRMSQYANNSQIIIGTHAGVSIGKDGASQMGLEDIAMVRTIPNSTIFVPADAVSAEKIMDVAVSTKGITYVRVMRAALPIIYPEKTSFQRGGSHTLRSSKRDSATIICSGITVFEALKAADELLKDGVHVRVIDAYCLHPLDKRALHRALRETRHLLTVEDHRQAGGLGEAVRSLIESHTGTIKSLAVSNTPHSGTMVQTLRHAGIDSSAIVRALRR